MNAVHVRGTNEKEPPLLADGGESCVNAIKQQGMRVVVFERQLDRVTGPSEPEGHAGGPSVKVEGVGNQLWCEAPVRPASQQLHDPDIVALVLNALGREEHGGQARWIVGVGLAEVTAQAVSQALACPIAGQVLDPTDVDEITPGAVELALRGG